MRGKPIRMRPLTVRKAVVKRRCPRPGCGASLYVPLNGMTVVCWQCKLEIRDYGPESKPRICGTFPLAEREALVRAQLAEVRDA